eukprot:3472139-Pyramimonas_sp.AAC.1
MATSSSEKTSLHDDSADGDSRGACPFRRTCPSRRRSDPDSSAAPVLPPRGPSRPREMRGGRAISTTRLR